MINKILEASQHLLGEKRAEINIDIDVEGKRILNKETSKFYSKELLNKAKLIEVIVTSVVVIEKMSKLKRCRWTIAELNERLYNSVEYFENRFDIDLDTWFDSPRIRKTEFKDDLDEKYPPKYKAIDGHRVHSRAELLIDNFLYTKGIIHAYGKKLPDACRYCDFYIPSGKGVNQPVYIEYWGLENDTKYLDRKNAKIKIYECNKLQLIELTDRDIENLEDSLTEKLRLFNIMLE